jgi:hypothetical protein
MMNQFSAARERKSLDMAVVKFLADGGKINKLAPFNPTDKKRNSYQEADTPRIIVGNRRSSKKSV